ncbi:hypothetical protein [Nesterenkonia ebinurensis]|uniref:hypothetical protein n=1 Tax=Nesterenkonia ebinurensis TaxID=2608252 RepID=UPI00123D73B3|nr:hypothetical protein [Nesterenkonia ebinurensis]
MAVTILPGPHTNPMFTGGSDPDAARFWRHQAPLPGVGKSITERNLFHYAPNVFALNLLLSPHPG